MIASVIVDIATKQVNQIFDYQVPPHLEDIIKTGYRVRVIFGNRTVLGFVVGLKYSTDYKKKLREISDVVDVYPILNEEFVALAKFMAEYYFTYYAVAIQTMIPSALKIKYQKMARAEQIPKDLEDLFKGKKEICIDHMIPSDLKRIYSFYRKGMISLDTKFVKNRKEKKIEYIFIKDETLPILSKQGKKLLAYMQELQEEAAVSVVMENTGFSKRVIQTLLDSGVLGNRFEEAISFKTEEKLEPFPYQMNEQQKKCYAELMYDTSKTYLLYGVTGSGKTLVYLNWIKDVVQHQKQAILLVPEIAITPQITSIFRSHFGTQVAILHSKLTISERYIEWKRILNQDVKIVIGARSAIFAPLNDLGIIIIDEEQESSYVQESNPRYNAIEIAKQRSKYHHCPLVLGSATPNVNDYYLAIEGEYGLMTMPTRANLNPLPTKTLVDMREELKAGNKSVLSRKLAKKLVEVYHRKEQSMLFLNRRGHSSFVMCRSCGEVIQCPHCDVSLTYHAYQNILSCHHCGYKRMNVETCPSCGSSKIRFVGSGTEKVMEEIQNLLPEATILRVDLDTTTKMVDYDSAFAKFKNHEADIMVGTQMIAKGLDFKDVTLVGVVNADLSLYYPSYDANMTAYNLIEQVSGRAGRGEKLGEVIVQTYRPEHFVLQAALHNDYDAFFKKEILNRKLTCMPPFSMAIEIMVEALQIDVAKKEIQHFLYALKKVAVHSEILGPAEALPFRIHDMYRYTIQVKVVEEQVVNKIYEIYPLYQTKKDVNLKIRRM